MKKVADLNFYSFIEFLKILEEKFPDCNFDYDNWEPFYLSITAVLRKDTEEGEISLEIKNPTDLVLEETVYPKPSDAKIDEENISFQICVHSWNSVALTVKKEAFDNDDFIQKLRSLIGKLAPVRRNSETWYEEIEKWVYEIIESSGVKNYCLEIKTVQ